MVSVSYFWRFELSLALGVWESGNGETFRANPTFGSLISENYHTLLSSLLVQHVVGWVSKSPCTCHRQCYAHYRRIKALSHSERLKASPHFADHNADDLLFSRAGGCHCPTRRPVSPGHAVTTSRQGVKSPRALVPPGWWYRARRLDLVADRFSS